MKQALFLLLVALVVTSAGCSGVSTVEKAELTTPAAREEYVAAHPGDLHNEWVRNGEITKGMSVHEVIASWGMPNVYIVSRTQPDEQWIYYVRDRDSLSMLIYTLTFGSDTLKVWDIEQKRFVGQGIVSNVDLPRETSMPTRPGEKKR